VGEPQYNLHSFFVFFEDGGPCHFNRKNTYWLTVGSTKFPILFKVAEIVFGVPTSQAAAERAWSIYDFILTVKD
jgi:hypothetical protein